MKSLSLTKELVESSDAIIIVTDHDDVDYQLVADHATLIVDTRHILVRKGLVSKNTVTA
jgi:UDP-N-acetyl-D-glucosamine dehydrogenase